MNVPAPGTGCGAGAAPAMPERALEAQRAIRYAALFQLIDEVQRRRGIADVAQVAAARFKHCADVSAWRLLCVHGSRAALIEASGGCAEVSELTFDAIMPWDAQQWAHALPQSLSGDALAAQRALLPVPLADAACAELIVLPVQQGDQLVALLAATSGSRRFDALDRKFLGHLAGSMAGRVVSIITEKELAAELVQAERWLAEQAQKATLQRLVNGVAHELNTPLGVQISALGTLAAMLQQLPEGSATLAAELHQVAELIGQQARRAAKIVHRLKQISDGAQIVTWVPTPLLATLEEIAQTCCDRPDAPQIVLAGEDEVELMLDREALAQLLHELIDNAAVHGRRGDAPCELLLELRSEQGHITLDIRDDGPGMDEASAARFFQPLFTTRQAQGHMGLGSYIARNTAREALQAELKLIRARGSADAPEGVWLQLDFGVPGG